MASIEEGRVVDFMVMVCLVLVKVRVVIVGGIGIDWDVGCGGGFCFREAIVCACLCVMEGCGRGSCRSWKNDLLPFMYNINYKVYER